MPKNVEAGFEEIQKTGVRNAKFLFINSLLQSIDDNDVKEVIRKIKLIIADEYRINFSIKEPIDEPDVITKVKVEENKGKELTVTTEEDAIKHEQDDNQKEIIADKDKKPTTKEILNNSIDLSGFDGNNDTDDELF